MINENLIKCFGKRIKQLRLDLKISQEQLAHLTGFHRTYIGLIERGERNISLSQIAVFAKVFKMNVTELLDFKSIEPEHNYESYQLKTEK